MDDRLTGRPVPDDTTDDDPSRVAMVGDGVARGAVDDTLADVGAGRPTDGTDGNAAPDEDDHPDVGASAEPGDQPGTPAPTGPGDQPGLRGPTGPGDQPRAATPADTPADTPAEADDAAPDEDEARPAKSRSH